MTQIVLNTPRVGAHLAEFSWTVEPPAALYQKTSFYLRFSEDVDVSGLPAALWWRVFLICLHPHWAVLRPCEVHLPITLPAGEKEFWRRLVAAYSMTLDIVPNRNRERPPQGGVTIIEDGPPLAIPDALPDLKRYGTAFSGGKDSLLQTGLLSELTDKPLLVTTTSPMPPLHDHLTARRRWIFSEIVKRRKVRWLEVKSDFRSSWDNAYPGGYEMATNELTDVQLYFAALLVVSAALGVTHLCVAAEAEVHENARLDGRIIQHRHFMYSSITQRALSAVLRSMGFQYGSLTSPLHAAQVQQLLWTRYPDIRDLQYSCWKVGLNEKQCSRCPSCLQMALCALAMGMNPEVMGIDLVTLFNRMSDWSPQEASTDPRRQLMPNYVVKVRWEGYNVRHMLAITPQQLRDTISESGRMRMAHPATWLALRRFARMRARMARYPVRETPGYWPAFLRLVDKSLREKIGAIYAEALVAEQESAYLGMLERSDEMVSWITAPIGGEGPR
jgi:hypothetical protein